MQLISMHAQLAFEHQVSRTDNPHFMSCAFLGTPASDSGSDAAISADSDRNSAMMLANVSSPVGELKLQLLRLYFVKSDPSTFSPLAAAAYASPPDVPSLATLLCRKKPNVHEGTPCGWQPLNLALIRGEEQQVSTNNSQRQTLDRERPSQRFSAPKQPRHPMNLCSAPRPPHRGSSERSMSRIVSTLSSKRTCL